MRQAPRAGRGQRCARTPDRPGPLAGDSWGLQGGWQKKHLVWVTDRQSPSAAGDAQLRPADRPGWLRRSVAGALMIVLGALLAPPQRAVATELGRAGAVLSGADLLALCGGAENQSPPEDACRAYFFGVRDALVSVVTAGAQRAACPPPGVSVDELVRLYRSESRRFPEVVDAPAARVITGMLLKFYPCRSAQSPWGGGARVGARVGAGAGAVLFAGRYPTV